MAIGDQFSGLDMKNLIGAPHGAAADANVQLAHSTADFINTVGFPIACVIALGYYIKSTQDGFTKTINELTKNHTTEIKELTSVLNDIVTEVKLLASRIEDLVRRNENEYK